MFSRLCSHKWRVYKSHVCRCAWVNNEAEMFHQVFRQELVCLGYILAPVYLQLWGVSSEHKNNHISWIFGAEFTKVKLFRKINPLQSQIMTALAQEWDHRLCVPLLFRNKSQEHEKMN